MIELKENKTPYELAIELKNNRILYKYMEEIDIKLRGEFELEWEVSCYSDYGVFSLKNTESGCYKFSLPLEIKNDLPILALNDILNEISKNIEGIILPYITPSNKFYFLYNFAIPKDLTYLSSGLLRFKADEKYIYEQLEILEKSIKTGHQVAENALKHFKEQNIEKGETENPWTSIQKLDNKAKFNESSLSKDNDDAEDDQDNEDNEDNEDNDHEDLLNLNDLESLYEDDDEDDDDDEELF